MLDHNDPIFYMYIIYYTESTAGRCYGSVTVGLRDKIWVLVSKIFRKPSPPLFKANSSLQ